MVIRVVSTLALLLAASPALAVDRLPYDIMNFSRTPAYNPQISYDVTSLLFERVPDHAALGYRVDELTGSTASHRVIRDFGPLSYDMTGLLYAYYVEDRMGPPAGAAP